MIVLATFARYINMIIILPVNFINAIDLQLYSKYGYIYIIIILFILHIKNNEFIKICEKYNTMNS